MTRSFRALLVALLITTMSVPAAAQFGPITVFDPFNYAKNTLTEINTLQTTINQATQIENELKALAYDLRNLQNFPSGLWGEVAADLAALERVAKVGQGISYADAHLSQTFAQHYPGYTAPVDYTVAYKAWGESNLASIQGALQVANLEGTQLASEDSVLSGLQSLSNGAAGNLQALQVGNMIAVAEVQQLQKLRQLSMGQMQGEFSYLATQQQADFAKFATLVKWLESQQNYRSSE